MLSVCPTEWYTLPNVWINRFGLWSLAGRIGPLFPLNAEYECNAISGPGPSYVLIQNQIVFFLCISYKKLLNLCLKKLYVLTEMPVVTHTHVCLDQCTCTRDTPTLILLSSAPFLSSVSGGRAVLWSPTPLSGCNGALPAPAPYQLREDPAHHEQGLSRCPLHVLQVLRGFEEVRNA